MEEASKQRTAPEAGSSFPVRVNGFERGWTIHGTPYSMTTYLATTKKDNADMNAVIYQVTGQEVAATDIREQGYCRQKAPHETFEILNDHTIEESEIWIYAVPEESVATPTVDYPIAQSYVDIFISGCLQLEGKYSVEGFAKECIETTNGWSVHWVNDRIYPRRPFIHQKNAAHIDKLLHSTVPESFKGRVIE